MLMPRAKLGSPHMMNIIFLVIWYLRSTSMITESVEDPRVFTDTHVYVPLSPRSREWMVRVEYLVSASIILLTPSVIVILPLSVQEVRSRGTCLVTCTRYIPYSRKIWRGIKYGSLVVYLRTHQIKIRQYFILAYIYHVW